MCGCCRWGWRKQEFLKAHRFILPPGPSPTASSLAQGLQHPAPGFWLLSGACVASPSCGAVLNCICWEPPHQPAACWKASSEMSWLLQHKLVLKAVIMSANSPSLPPALLLKLWCTPCWPPGTSSSISSSCSCPCFRTVPGSPTFPLSLYGQSGSTAAEV